MDTLYILNLMHISWL